MKQISQKAQDWLDTGSARNGFTKWTDEIIRFASKMRRKGATYPAICAAVTKKFGAFAEMTASGAARTLKAWGDI
jgi:hypothetical protein